MILYKHERAPYGARFFVAETARTPAFCLRQNAGKGRRLRRRPPRAAKRLAARARTSAKQRITTAALEKVGQESGFEKAAVRRLTIDTLGKNGNVLSGTLIRSIQTARTPAFCLRQNAGKRRRLRRRPPRAAKRLAACARTSAKQRLTTAALEKAGQKSGFEKAAVRRLTIDTLGKNENVLSGTLIHST